MIPRSNREATDEEAVEIRFLEGVLKRCPSDTKVLQALGDLYTHTGRYEEGLAIDLKLSKLSPDEPVIWYNLGCSYALVGQKDKAFEVLNHAVDLGYRDVDWMSEDEDLANLREDLRLERLYYRMITGIQKPTNARGDA